MGNNMVYLLIIAMLLYSRILEICIFGCFLSVLVPCAFLQLFTRLFSIWINICEPCSWIVLVHPSVMPRTIQHKICTYLQKPRYPGLQNFSLIPYFTLFWSFLKIVCKKDQNVLQMSHLVASSLQHSGVSANLLTCWMISWIRRRNCSLRRHSSRLYLHN